MACPYEKDADRMIAHEPATLPTDRRTVKAACDLTI